MSKESADTGKDIKRTAVNGDPESNKDADNTACSGDEADSDEEKDSKESDDDSEDDKSDDSEETACRILLEVLPSKGGLLLAVLLAEIMTEGLTPSQMGLLSAFIVSVGDLIGYKATRESLLSD